MIERYEESMQEKWDKFVMHGSVNGTLLQTRNFLNYHPEGRFCDHSLVIKKNTTIVAVIPAHERMDDGHKCLISHGGSTFGGIVVGKDFLKIKEMDLIFEELEVYLRDNGFAMTKLKLTGDIFCSARMELLEYYLHIHDYTDQPEIGYYLDLSDTMETLMQSFTASRRRDVRYALKNNYRYRELTTDAEVEAFYEILLDNLSKFDTKPVHTLEELLDFKNNRFPEEVRFLGIELEGELIGGGMYFIFGGRVMHAQYLAVRQDKLKFFPSEYLYYAMLSYAMEQGYRTFSFGTATLEGGRVLNKGLAQYKEGYGTQTYLNHIFTKRFS